MAKTAKKQTAKRKTNTTAAKKTETPKKIKKPASFSKSATAKQVIKKPAKRVIRKTTESAEFETMKLDLSKKTTPSSRIILRDVAKEQPVSRVMDIKPKAPVKSEVKAVAPEPAKAQKITAKEIKEQEIEKAIKAATKLPATEDNSRRQRKLFGEFGWARAVLAATCVATIVFATIYFINLASSDMSIKVAAMQSGIEATYPAYVPRGYELSDVVSSSGKITMHFNGEEGSFGLTEENSSWDSEALLNNYVKPTYNTDYTVIRENGLTLYMGNDWEAWVNGGKLYKLSVDSGSLTKKQMKSIATSL